MSCADYNPSNFDSFEYKITKFLEDKDVGKNPFFNQYLKTDEFCFASGLKMDARYYLQTLFTEVIISVYGDITIVDTFIINALTDKIINNSILSGHLSINDCIGDFECDDPPAIFAVMVQYAEFALGYAYNKSYIDDMLNRIDMPILALFIRTLALMPGNTDKDKANTIMSEMVELSQNNLDERVINAFLHPDYGKWIPFSLRVLNETVDWNKVAPFLKETVVNELLIDFNIC